MKHEYEEWGEQVEAEDSAAEKSAVNNKMQTYMVAVLQNPRFFDWAAKRYGNIDIGGVPNLAVGPLATAIFQLERELKEVYTAKREVSRGSRK
jgi:hypothetical protein